MQKKKKLKLLKMSKMLKIFTILLLMNALFFVQSASAQHPCLFASNNDKASIQAKIKNEPWAKEAWKQLLQSIDKYVSRHQTDPQWIISRLAMYWKSGEHYTQCYLKKETWDYGEGNAPVPTVRLPGMRTWNEYANVPLESRIPYNETGDMKAISNSNPAAGVVLVPYKKSGHLIRGNNVEILTLAEKASFAYWITGDEKYAKFAADIFNVWVLGTYYMNPVLDPGKSSGGIGGYAPGGILGYYDYEQIHDDLSLHAAYTYDFIFDYLQLHPAKNINATGENISEVATLVFKRFIDIGMVRGGKSGNWNVNGWEMIMPDILLLKPDSAYADGHGKEYYLRYYTTTTTLYHEALPGILKEYDAVTGLWPESPGYAMGTIASLLNMAMPLYKTGINTVQGNPMMQKAALALFAWLDARGNTLNFGDSRGGPGNFTAFERLLTYYTWVNDTLNAKLVASAIEKGMKAGQYSRDKSNWVGICLHANLPVTASDANYAKIAYSPTHRNLVMKNGNDVNNGLMFMIYGGYPRQRHLSPNGLALQLYGKGWALAPDASGYESYWSADYNYHQTATGSNTILPGYDAGPVTINAMEPTVSSLSFTNDKSLSGYCSFADISASEKRRTVAMIRTSPSTGYYIDIFRSNLPDNDYIYHNLGNNLSLTNEEGKPLSLNVATDLDKNYSKAYSYFMQPQKAAINKDLYARWVINSTSPSIVMDMWMKGERNRDVFKLVAPYSSLVNTVTPGKINVAPNNTLAIIVRQQNTNGFKTPFIAVFEPYEAPNKSIKKITSMASDENFASLLVQSNSLNETLTGRKEYICNSVDDQLHLTGNQISFRGIFGIVCENAKGFQYLYLGSGKLLQKGNYKIEAASSVSACLSKDEKGLWYSSGGDIKITLPFTNRNNKQLFYLHDGQKMNVKTIVNTNDKSVTGIFPAGYNIIIVQP